VKCFYLVGWLQIVSKLLQTCVSNPFQLAHQNFKGTTTKLASSEFWGTNSVVFSTKIWDILKICFSSVNMTNFSNVYGQICKIICIKKFAFSWICDVF
jgi:hypothetical protein